MFIKSPGLIEKERKILTPSGLPSPDDSANGPGTLPAVETRMKRVSLQRFMAVQEAKRVVAKTSWTFSSPWSGLAEIWTNNRVRCRNQKKGQPKESPCDPSCLAPKSNS